MGKHASIQASIIQNVRLLKVFEVYCDTKVHIVTADEEYFFLCI